MPPQSFTLGKQERLCSQKVIQELFETGRSFSVFPFRVVWMPVEQAVPFPAQVAFAVPKKKLKRAVDRNRTKRLMREAYRKHKSILYDPWQEQGKNVALILIYLASEPLSYAQIEQKIILTLHRLVKEERKH